MVSGSRFARVDTVASTSNQTGNFAVVIMGACARFDSELPHCGLLVRVAGVCVMSEEVRLTVLGSHLREVLEPLRFKCSEQLADVIFELPSSVGNGRDEYMRERLAIVNELKAYEAMYRSQFEALDRIKAGIDESSLYSIGISERSSGDQVSIVATKQGEW